MSHRSTVFGLEHRQIWELTHGVRCSKVALDAEISNGNVRNLCDLDRVLRRS